MREIEIKAKLKDKDKVMEKLKALGCSFESPITQSDTVYAEDVDTLENFRSGTVFLRLRVKNNSKVLFTLKTRGVNDLDSPVEIELEVSSKEEMEKAIIIMGYKEAITVNKTRVITHYNNCEICIDDVENLGMFIEMEKLTEEGNSQEIQEEMFKFFESLGITHDDRVMSGYDILMWQKKLGYDKSSIINIDNAL